MASNPYVNKVQLADGTTVIDISDTTAVASDVAQGKWFYTASGEKKQGNSTGGVIITDTTDTGGGTIREITASTLSLETLTATQNDTYTAPSGTAYNEVVVNVSGGGGGLEYEEGTWTPSADIARPTISFTNTHTERPFYVLISDISGEERNTDDMLAWAIINWYDAFGFGLKVTSSQTNYARTQGVYKTAASFGAGTGNISSLDGDGNTTMGYYLTNTAFYPYGNASTRYWRANRTYKWIAVWKPTT